MTEPEQGRIRAIRNRIAAMPPRKKGMLVLAACVAAAAAYALLFVLPGTSPRSAGKGADAQARAVPVVTVPAKKGDIHVYINGIGTVTPLKTVTVRSRVDGQLMQVLFKEGQVVTENQLLAEIDPRPFQAQLMQAQGQLAKDQALLTNARLDLTRYEELIKDDSISKQQYDTQRSLVQQLEGTVKTDQGAVENAKLQLLYSRVMAPINGRIGLRLVDEGNIVRASDANGLAVITQLQPISVIFSIPEDSLRGVLGLLTTGKPVTVYALSRDQSQNLAEGTLLTVDNQVDPATGTVRLKATFPNAKNELFPNQFVNARLLLDTRKQTIVVPVAALQRSTRGAFVYVVTADSTASVRPVKEGPAEGDLVSIENGLAPDDLVVVEGADRLRDGAKVEPQKPLANGNGAAKGKR